MNITKAISCALGVAVVLCCSTASANLMNGGFETGDLTGWYSQGAVQAVQWEYARDFLGLSQPPASGFWDPAGGNYFASLWSQEEDFFPHTDSYMRQTFTTPEPGWQLNFDYFYDFGDVQGYWATASIIVMDGVGTPIWWRSINDPGAGTGLADDENIDWTHITVPLASAGTYTLEFSIYDHPFGGFESILGVDDVQVVPVPAAVVLGILGMGMAGLKLRKHA